MVLTFESVDKSQSVAIQMKSCLAEYFPVVLFIMLFIIFNIESVNQILTEMKDSEKYFLVFLTSLFDLFN